MKSAIEQPFEWWKDKTLLADFDERCKALDSGADKGFTIDELEASIKKLRLGKYKDQS